MEEYARKHGPHDLERLGLFIEMPYLKVSRPPKPKKEKKQQVKAPFVVSGPKTKSATQDGYFDEEFKRAFEGDLKKVIKKEKKKVATKLPFTPVGAGKLHSSPGDFYGCFVDEWPEHFSPAVRVPKKKTKDKKPIPVRHNPMTNPGKKGGPGFLDITINPYPEHANEPPPKKKKEKKKPQMKPPFYGNGYPGFFDDNPFEEDIKKPIYIPPKVPKDKKKTIKVSFMPTGPGKLPGGCHDGTFDPFPEHMRDPYTPVQKGKPKGKKKKEGAGKPNFVPICTAPRTMFTVPLLANVEFTVHKDNYKHYLPNYTKYL